jgi:predicted acyltransferase
VVTTRAVSVDASGRSARDRLRFLDVARALAVLAMLVANLVNVFPAERPHWLGHNMGDELLPLDLPAPMFQFLIGVSLALFLERRRDDDRWWRARVLAARRFLMLIALGALLDGVLAHRLEFRWGVLQTLGAGGLLAVALAGLPDAAVLVVAAVITATYYGPGNNPVHRSLTDCVPFLAITLMGYVVGHPLAARDRARYERRAVTIALACLGLSLVLRICGVPFNKVTGTSSFVLLASAASAAFIAALSQLERRGWHFADVLVRLGASALTAWVLLYVLVYYPIDLFVGHELALPEVSGLLAVVLCVAALSAVTLALARRGIRVPI